MESARTELVFNTNHSLLPGHVVSDISYDIQGSNDDTDGTAKSTMTNTNIKMNPNDSNEVNFNESKARKNDKGVTTTNAMVIHVVRSANGPALVPLIRCI